MAAVVVHSCGNSAVEMVYDICKPPDSQVCISNKKNDKSVKEPYVTLGNGVIVRGLLTTIKTLVKFSEKINKTESSLLGQDPLEKAEVDQWLEQCLTQIIPCLNDVAEMLAVLKLLNVYIVDRVYFVGEHLTVVDLLLFATLHGVYRTLTFQQKETFIHVSRWFKQVQNQPSITDPTADVQFLRNLIYQ